MGATDAPIPLHRAHGAGLFGAGLPMTTPRAIALAFGALYGPILLYLWWLA